MKTTCKYSKAKIPLALAFLSGYTSYASGNSEAKLHFFSHLGGDLVVEMPFQGRYEPIDLTHLRLGLNNQNDYRWLKTVVTNRLFDPIEITRIEESVNLIQGIIFARIYHDIFGGDSEALTEFKGLNINSNISPISFAGWKLEISILSKENCKECPAGYTYIDLEIISPNNSPSASWGAPSSAWGEDPQYPTFYTGSSTEEAGAGFFGTSQFQLIFNEMQIRINKFIIIEGETTFEIMPTTSLYSGHALSFVDTKSTTEKYFMLNEIKDGNYFLYGDGVFNWELSLSNNLFQVEISHFGEVETEITRIQNNEKDPTKITKDFKHASLTTEIKTSPIPENLIFDYTPKTMRSIQLSKPQSAGSISQNLIFLLILFTVTRLIILKLNRRE